MVETAIASAFVLVPLFLAIPLLGKYIDIKINSEEAARYAAFEGTVFDINGGTLRGANVATLSNSDLNNAIATRFFGQSPDNISASQNQTASNFAPKNLLMDHAGNNLLPKYSDVSTNITNNAPSTATDPEDEALKVSLGALAGLTGFEWDYNGLITATVAANAVAPAPVRDKSWAASGAGAFDGLQLPFSSTDVILSDVESGPNPQTNQNYVHNQISSLVPLSKLSAVNDALKVLKYAEPDLSGLDIGKIVTDSPNEVPYDRLASTQSSSGSTSSGQTGAQNASTIISEMETAGNTLQSETTNAGGSITLIFKTPQGTTIPITIASNGTSPSPSGNKTTTQYSNSQPDAVAQQLTNSLTNPPKGETPWQQTTAVTLLQPVPGWNYSNNGTTGEITSTFIQTHTYDNSTTTETMVVTITPEYTAKGAFIDSKIITTTTSATQ